MKIDGLKKYLVEAKEALGELPSVAQSVGTLAQLAKRCKTGSTLSDQRWELYEDANRQVADLSSKIRMALRLLEEHLEGEKK